MVGTIILTVDKGQEAKRGDEIGESHSFPTFPALRPFSRNFGLTLVSCHFVPGVRLLVLHGFSGILGAALQSHFWNLFEELAQRSCVRWFSIWER